MTSANEFVLRYGVHPPERLLRMPNQQPPLCTTASELVVREQAVSSIQLLRKRGRLSVIKSRSVNSGRSRAGEPVQFSHLCRLARPAVQRHAVETGTQRLAFQPAGQNYSAADSSFRPAPLRPHPQAVMISYRSNCDCGPTMSSGHAQTITCTDEPRSMNGLANGDTHTTFLRGVSIPARD